LGGCVPIRERMRTIVRTVMTMWPTSFAARSPLECAVALAGETFGPPVCMLLSQRADVRALGLDDA
jgi:hypothetical protein